MLLASSVNNKLGVNNGLALSHGDRGIKACRLYGPDFTACTMPGLFVNPAILQCIAPTLLGISFRVSSICLTISCVRFGAFTATVFNPGQRCRLCVFSDSHHRKRDVKLCRGGSIGQYNCGAK